MGNGAREKGFEVRGLRKGTREEKGIETRVWRKGSSEKGRANTGLEKKKRSRGPGIENKV